jgi:hypothetical protein
MDPLIGLLQRGDKQVPYVMESSGNDGQMRPLEFNSIEEAEEHCAKARAYAERMREAAADLDREFGL